MAFVVLIFILISSFCGEAYSQDTSCGIVWQNPIQLSPQGTEAYHPRIVTQGDTIHVVFENNFSYARLPYVRSTNGGLNFEPVRNLITDTLRFWCPNIGPIFPVTNGRLLYIFFLGGTDGLGTTPIYMMISSDRGETWTDPRAITDTNAAIRNVSIMGDTIAVLSSIDGMPWERIVFSTDAGNTWSVSSEPIVAALPKVALSRNWLHLVYYRYLDGYSFDIIYKRSSDFGMTWQDSTVLSTLDNHGGLTASIAASEDGKIFVTWTDSKYGCNIVGCSVLFRRSTDDGSSWLEEQVLTNTPWGDWSKVTVKDSMIMTSWMGGNGNEFHIEGRLSYDLGNTWCPVVNLSSSQSSYSVYPTNIIAVHSVITAWEQRVPASNQFYIATKVGTFSPVSVAIDGSTAPTNYQVMSPFPNPFNNSTIIHYNIPHRERVKMTIMNLLGQQVAELIDEVQESGWHEALWHADNVSSGVYFYRLSAGNFSSTGKTVLIK